MIHKINAKRIYIKEDSDINSEAVLSADRDGRGDIVIGKNVQIGPYVAILATDHNYKKKDILIMNQGHQFGHVIIGNDVWIGAHVTILRGSVIPDGCVIGACSLVTRHHILEPYCAYVGNPLRKIGKRT